MSHTTNPTPYWHPDAPSDVITLTDDDYLDEIEQFQSWLDYQFAIFKKAYPTTTGVDLAKAFAERMMAYGRHRGPWVDARLKRLAHGRGKAIVKGDKCVECGSGALKWRDGYNLQDCVACGAEMYVFPTALRRDLYASGVTT